MSVPPPPRLAFLACFGDNEVPPHEQVRRSPPTPNMKLIIFHELVDRFSHRPRFPAAPQPNYRRLAIRHRGDSKKSTHPSPTRARVRRHPTPASIFIKTQTPTATVPLVPAAAPRSPHPSSPSRFLRDVGACHPGGGGDRANAKY